MGSNISQSNSNSNISKSEKQSSNSAKNGLKMLGFTRENSRQTINRVWIAKRTIQSGQEQILGIYNMSKYAPSENIKDILEKNEIEPPIIEASKPNLFNISNRVVPYFKHWAIILELYNDTFVNIQFGRTGISLKEFSGKERCENVLYAISDTWGDQTSPISFCYLGIAKYNNYRSLLKYLNRKKSKEKDLVDKNGKVFYHLTFSNCQHFVCEIEALLFEKIKFWHSFPYYLEDFYQTFFHIEKNEMNIFLSLLKDRVDKFNQNIYENNVKRIEEYATKCKKRLSGNDSLKVRNDLINNCDIESTFIKLEIYECFK